MPAYRCRSHDRSDCRDAVCRRQAERAGLITPPAPRASRAAGGAAAPVSNARREAVARARAGELWVGPAEDMYGAGGQTRGSMAHLPGGVCAQTGGNPDSSGLYAGWGRVEGNPKAVADLISGKPVMATDGSGLMAVQLCKSCRTIIG